MSSYSKQSFETCSSFIGFHATSADFQTFDPAIGGAQFHVGTASQATMRAAGTAHPTLLMVSVYATHLIRKKDSGGNWKRPSAREADAADGVVYLNRYEGVPINRLDALSGESVQTMSDAEFLRRVPEARDSYGIFQPHNCKIVERIDWKSDRHLQLLDYDKTCTLPLTERHAPFPLAVTQEAIERAKAFCLKTWRATSDGATDLSGSCHITSLFAREVFGGRVIGNSEHQFIRLHDGDVLDLNMDSEAVAQGASYEVDEAFLRSPEYAQQVSAANETVQNWLQVFSREEKTYALSVARQQKNEAKAVSPAQPEP